MPRFVTDRSWAFEGKVEAGANEPAGFDPAAAADGARFNGYYLFQVV